MELWDKDTLGNRPPNPRYKPKDWKISCAMNCTSKFTSLLFCISHKSTISLPLSYTCKWELGNLSQDRPIRLALCNGAARILCQMAALTQIEHCLSSHWSVSAHMFRERASLQFQTAHSCANNTIGTVSEWVWCMEGPVDVSQYYCDMLQLHHAGGSGCVAILLWYNLVKKKQFTSTHVRSNN